MKKLLEEMKQYIEKVERQIEGEWGCGRSIEELIEENEMPEIYQKVINALSDQK